MNFNDQRQHITLTSQDYGTTTWLSISDKTKLLEAGTCICLTPDCNTLPYGAQGSLVFPNVILTYVSYDPFGIELDPVYGRLTVNDVAIKTPSRKARNSARMFLS